jgi:hypothetical protein
VGLVIFMQAMLMLIARYGWRAGVQSAGERPVAVETLQSC